METTVYLIRHSVRLNMKNNIESYNTTQESLIKSEKIILSVTGERRAENQTTKNIQIGTQDNSKTKTSKQKTKFTRSIQVDIRRRK